MLCTYYFKWDLSDGVKNGLRNGTTTKDTLAVNSDVLPKSQESAIFILFSLKQHKLSTYVKSTSHSKYYRNTLKKNPKNGPKHNAQNMGIILQFIENVGRLNICLLSSTFLPHTYLKCVKVLKHK